MSIVSVEREPRHRDEIFISYSRRDKAWVDGYLKRVLTAADVPFAIDEEDLEIGAVLQDNIRELLQQCRYTLLVMTPDWVNRKWTHYEGLLAAEYVHADQHRRILPLKLKHCDVPAHLQPHLHLDLCTIEHRDRQMLKLLRQLGVSEERIAKAQTSIAKKTLQLLIELMNEPGVQDELVSLRQNFEHIKRRNHVVTANKTLHDLLQAIQLTLAQVLRDSGKMVGAAGDWNFGRFSVAALRRQIRKLTDYAESLNADPIDMAFATRLKHSGEQLHQAFKEGQECDFQHLLEIISNEVNLTLPLINDRIIQNLRERPLDDLIDGMRAVYERLATFDFEPDPARLLDEFRDGIEGLEELGVSIQDLVADHATLQQADVHLRWINGSGEPSFRRIHLMWSYMEQSIPELRIESRYAELMNTFGTVDSLLADPDCIRDDRYENNVRSGFADFVEELSFSFNTLDVDLRQICEQLDGHGVELQQIFVRMQDHETDPQ